MEGGKPSASDPTRSSDDVTIEMGGGSNRVSGTNVIGAVRKVSTLQLSRRVSGTQVLVEKDADGITVSRRTTATPMDTIAHIRRRASGSTIPNVFAVNKPLQVEQIPVDAKDALKKLKEKSTRVEFTEHTWSLQELAFEYSTNIDFDNPKKSDGLTAAQAAKLLKEHGPNCLTPPPRIPLWLLYIYQFGNLLMMLLLFAGILSIVSYAADPKSGIQNLYIGVFLIVVIFGTCYQTFAQEASADNLMEKFRNLVPEKAQVIRDGIQLPTEALDIVIGDIVRLQSGDKIPADCRVIVNSSMKVDQSMITGESEPIDVSVVAMDDKPLEAKNIIFNGSLVVDGSCLAVAIRTGDHTLIGGMVELTGDAGENVSTLKADVEYFVKRLAIFAFLQGVIVLVVGCARGLNPLNTFISGFIVIILSNVPEGLPSTVTALLYIIALRMGEQNVFVKKLDIIETLGSCSLICSDKTGTLTQNKMTVANMWCPDREFSSDEFDAEGNNPNDAQLHALKEVAALNSRVTMERKTPESELVPNGDATELGLYNFFNKFVQAKTGNNLEHYRDVNTKIHEIPFNSSNKWQMSIHKLPEKGREFLFLKGAPDILLNKCSSYLNQEGREVAIDEQFMALYTKTYEEFGGRGERVLGFARKEMRITLAEEEQHNPAYKDELKEQLIGKKEGVLPINDLCFIGLVTLIDPPRPEVLNAIAECNSAGVKVVMVTGDHPLTAQAIARKIGLITLPTRESIAKDKNIPKEDVNEDDCGAVVIHGSTIPGMSDADWDIVLSKKEIVFARTSPEQKLSIVKKFKGKGLITAMTGDGVNDSPALKQADIGIAMGLNGSDVAREAAALVLLDDNFASIVMGIREGRLLYTNLKKSIAYTLAHMTSEVVPIIMWAFFGIPLAMTGVTVLCIDLITELLPSISLAYEKIESNIMQVPPRDLKTDKLVTLQVASYSYAQIGVIECGVCWLVWFQVCMHYICKLGVTIC